MRGTAYATCPKPHAGDEIEITVLTCDGFLARTTLEPADAMKLARMLRRFAVERTKAECGIESDAFGEGPL